ncbi:MAG TPA: rod shape-determining protein MreC [Actinomycetota bacterium]|nr:rod shape-determining protein MreC [Actinomycetota bacterium]
MYRRNGRGRVLLLVFISLSIVVITLDFRQGDGGPLQRAKDVSIAVVAPIQRGLTSVFRPVGNFFASVGEMGRLRSENARLKDEIDAMREEVQQAEAQEDQFTSALELLELDEPWTAMETVNASVIGYAPSNYRWARLLDKGSDDGIRKNMAVVNAEGLVGKILSVGKHESVVLLLIDPKAAAGARVEGRRDTGKIQGNGEAEGLSLELIASDSDIAEGDLVVTSGYDAGVFPPGIPIGLVDEVVGDVRRPDQTIVVDPFVDFTALDYVRILLDTGSRVAGDDEATR